VTLPVGYAIEIGGQVQSQRKAFTDLLLVLGVAAALVLVVLVAEFRAIIPALLILFVAPLSAGGAFLLLLLTGTELNVSSAMGLILLVGLVVKNGIVLMDFAARGHAAGASWRESLVAAGARRFRPIMMTTLCTLAGLVPLAFGLGAGAELQRPLALAVIGGLSLSLLVPAHAPALFLLVRRSDGARGLSPLCVSSGDCPHSATGAGSQSQLSAVLGTVPSPDADGEIT
jgi:multidrug efflux pump subunit AcrB